MKLKLIVLHPKISAYRRMFHGFVLKAQE